MPSATCVRTAIDADPPAAACIAPARAAPDRASIDPTKTSQRVCMEFLLVEAARYATAVLAGMTTTCGSGLPTPPYPPIPRSRYGRRGRRRDQSAFTGRGSAPRGLACLNLWHRRLESG